MPKLRDFREFNSDKAAVKIGYRPSRMDRVSDAAKGVLAIPVEDQEQMNIDMKTFINKHKLTSRNR